MDADNGTSIGLIATPGGSGDAAIRHLLSAFMEARRAGWNGILRPVAETADVLRGLDVGLPPECLRPFPPVRLGGLVRMVAGLLSVDAAVRVDQVVSLLEPGDPLGLFPEVQALKRECVVQRRPYLPNVETARQWWQQEAGDAPYCQPEERTIALVAHDALKGEMLAFAARHRRFLASFKGRIATGTTGTLLNGRLPDRLPQAERDALAPLAGAFSDGGWVECLRSGPRGGDVEIADRILDQACDVVVFFEDPHVSREHDSDIQLLERVVRLPGIRCLCFHDPVTADAWATRAARGAVRMKGAPLR